MGDVWLRLPWKNQTPKIKITEEGIGGEGKGLEGLAGYYFPFKSAFFFQIFTSYKCRRHPFSSRPFPTLANPQNSPIFISPNFFLPCTFYFQLYFLFVLKDLIN